MSKYRYKRITSMLRGYFILLFLPLITNTQAAAQESAESGVPATDYKETIEEVTVFGRGVRGDSVRDVPQTATVFNEELLEFIPGSTVQDALRFIPSASNLLGDYAFGSNFNIRGFRTSATWNGMIPGVAPNRAESANVERVEVLMGPAAVLYGSMEPGAVINIVTKQPQAVFHSQLDFTAGSFETYGAEADIGGPISERVAVRLNASYLDRGAPFDHWEQETFFFAPVVAFDLGDRTSLTLEGSYRRSDYGGGIYDGRIPVVGTLQPNPNGSIPLSVNPGYVVGATELTDDWKDAHVRLRHELSSSLTLNAQLTYGKMQLNGVDAFAGALLADNRSLFRFFGPRDQGQENYLAAVNLAGAFDTGSIQHQLTVGLDYADSEESSVFGDFTGTVPPLDLFDPDYNVEGPLNYESSFWYQGDRRVAAAFIQDRFSVGTQWTIHIGLRYTDSKSENALTPPDQPFTQLPVVEAQEWSSQFGILYEPTDMLVFYANRSNSFTPREAIPQRDGSVFNAPETAVQHELGMRIDLYDSRMFANVALFHIEKPNVLTTDPVDPRFRVDAGAVEARGVELSLNGSPLPGWTLYVNYAYNDTEVTKANVAGVLGKRFVNSPEHTASLISRYDIQSGALEGLGFSVAVNHLAEKYADALNALELPASTRLDLGAYYPLSDRVRISALVSNVTDEEIYNGFSTALVMRNAGRTYSANVNVRY